MATIKFFDVEKILDKKINTYERFKVKQFITEKNLDRIASNVLPGNCTNTTSTTFTVSGLVAGEDWRKVLYDGSSAYEPVFIENYYYVISGITAPADGEQVVTVTHKRLLTANAFSSVGTLETFSAKKAYRKTWSPVSQTFLADHQIDTQITLSLDTTSTVSISGTGSGLTGNIAVSSSEAAQLSVGDVIISSVFAKGTTITSIAGTDITPSTLPNNTGSRSVTFETISRNGISVIQSDSDVNSIEYILEDSKDSVILEVDKGDEDTGYTKITSRPASNFFSGKYLTDSITGKLIVNNPIFDGFVETKKADVKQAFKYEIVGRDSINKLLNTTLDKNYVHSQEFVHTTFNPYVGDTTSSTELEYVSLIANSISGKEITTHIDPTSALSYGDTIAFDVSDDRYIVLGVVESVSSSPNKVTLMKDCYITDLSNIGSTTLNSNRIYRIRKSIIPSKNLETTPRVSSRATSIVGTLDKGIIFGAGKEFNSSGDTNLLSLGKGAGIENGYDIDNFLTPITNSDSEYLEFPLGFETQLNIPASTPDLKIVFSDTRTDNSVDYEIGYISPIVLGMVAKNENDKFITTGSDDLGHPIRLINGQGLPDGGFLHLLSSYTNSDYSPKTFNNIFSDDPSYTSSTTDQYATRYNMPIFRYANTHISKNNILLQPYANKFSKLNQVRFDTDADAVDLEDVEYSRNDYFENTANFNYYLSAYKLNFKKIDYHDTYTDFYMGGIPKEQTGLYPALGSKFFDINRIPGWFYNRGTYFGNRFSTDSKESLPFFVGRMELHDPSALSMHLFSLGDVYPESKKNQNNIFYTNRDLNDYALLFKNKKSNNAERDKVGYTHFSDTHSPNLIQVSNRIDSDYHVEPIISSSGEQFRFNLMRLTDVTMDMLFNEVDYENVEINNKGTEISKSSHLTDGGIGFYPTFLIKSFSEAGLYYKDMKVTSAHSDLNKLNVNNTGWYDSDFNYYLYGFINNLNYPTYIGKVSSATSNVITFTSAIDQLFNVTDMVLYVRVTIADLDSFASAAYKIQMLLTNNSEVPHIREGEDALPHNYLSTSVMVNSNLETNESSDADKTFILDGSLTDPIGAILRTPIFVEAGTLANSQRTVIPALRSTLDASRLRPALKMQIPATYTGNTITIASSHNSELTKYFNLHRQSVFAVSTSNTADPISVTQKWFWDGTGSIPATNRNLEAVGSAGGFEWEVSGSNSTTDNVITGWKFSHPNTSGGGFNVTYTIVRVISSTNFIAYPAHSGESLDHQWQMEESKRSNSSGGFISITGLQSGYDANYIVTGYTDNTLTIENMAGQNPSLPTQSSEVTLTIAGADPDYNPNGNLYESGGTLKSYHQAWVEDVNGHEEPIYYHRHLNSVVPHRAWHDFEERMDITSLDQVFLRFGDIPEVQGQFVSLPQEVKEVVGSISEDSFSGINERKVGYRRGSAVGSKTQRWNKGIFAEYVDDKGPLSENFQFGATQFQERMFSAEMLFRPYIDVTTSMIINYSASKASGDTTLVDNEERILKFDVDLNPANHPATNHWVNYCNNLTGYYFRNGNEIHKVISHEINREENNVSRHLLKLYNASTLGNGDKIYLMRINQVCMYDFSPKKIILNRAKHEYTKIPGKDKMHKNTYDATKIHGNNDGGNMVLEIDNSVQGIKSMYVLIDPDGTNTNSFLETRNSTKARSYSQITSEGKRVFVTDGVNELITDVRKTGSVIEFSDIKKMLGTPSIGSTFSVRVNKTPGFKPESVCIGVPFKIVDELESAINDAFTINDISYTQDTEDDKYYGAFNFTGQSLYSAANNLLSYKNKEILVDGEEIKIVDKEDEKKYRNIVLSSKNSDFQITSISNDVSLLDNFDEVIVIGDGVRGIARNPISTADANRTIKTKEIYDYSILDQRQADLKAIQYLDVFNTANTSIEIEVADNVPFLKPGHIIELEFEEQNIPRGDYLVIETEKEFGAPTKFILSEYSKDLAGTFSLLLGEIRNLQGFTKQKVYTSTTIPRIKRGKVNIKFVKSTATQGTGSGVTSTIGFGYTIGFNSEVGV